MKTFTLNVKAKAGDTVFVPQLELTTQIIGVYIDGANIKYEIVYFHAGKRENAYLYAHEFEVRNG
jgi:hypothetical protein